MKLVPFTLGEKLEILEIAAFAHACESCDIDECNCGHSAAYCSGCEDCRTFYLGDVKYRSLDEVVEEMNKLEDGYAAEWCCAGAYPLHRANCKYGFGFNPDAIAAEPD